MSTVPVPISTAAVPRTQICRQPVTSRPVTSLRLTRRGRLVVTTLLLVVVFAAVVLFGGSSAATDEIGPRLATRTIVVDEGDTLWSIASRMHSAGGAHDIRALVHNIETMNALGGPELVEGQQLALPLP